MTVSSRAFQGDFGTEGRREEDRRRSGNLPSPVFLSCLFFTCYFSVSLVFVAFYHDSLSVRGSRGSALGS